MAESSNDFGLVDSVGGVPNIPETVNYVIDVISKLPKK